MGEFQTFATNVLRFSKKRGRAPMMNANKFYPRKEERELEDLVRAEFERSWRAALAVALNGWQDSMEEMLGMGSQLPEDFRKAIGETGEKIVNNAQNNLVKFSEMTIGTPYYPPNLEESVKKDWEATFQQLCISAETDAKARIARLVNEGKTQGMNKLQVEALVKKELPAETKHRAELISRTETAKLNNAATMATYESAGIRYYRWLASIDDRTRPTHAAMQGLICSVENPDVYYEETPDGLVEHDRGPDRYHGDPGTDYQCRCTSVPWDPRIDGKYQVKEAPEPEPKEPSKLEVSREETKKAEARAQKAEKKADILQKSQERHQRRTQEQAEKIRIRWDDKKTFDSIGIKKLKTKDPVGEIKKLNPNFKTGKQEYKDNCYKCAATFEATMRGYSAEALPHEATKKYGEINTPLISPQPNGDLQISHAGLMSRIYEGQINEIAYSKRADIEKEMLSWGEGARAHIFCLWKKDGGHVFNAIVKNGTVHYIDTQLGGLALDLTGDMADSVIFKSIKATGTYAVKKLKFTRYNVFVRTDNLRFKNDVLTEIMKPR